MKFITLVQLLQGVDVCRNEMQKLYRSYLKTYDIILVEDPFAEDDWASCAEFTSKVDVEVRLQLLCKRWTDDLCKVVLDWLVFLLVGSAFTATYSPFPKGKQAHDLTLLS